MKITEQKNPFFYGGIVKAEFFCNRIAKKEELKRDINNKLNILIYAPRRFGKTSLVLETLKELECKYIFIDFMNITSEEEFINKYFNAIVTKLKKRTDKIIDFFKNILDFKPSINIHFNSTNEPSFSLSFSKKEVKQTLESVLNLPLELAKIGENIVIVFDEFQEIETLGSENTFRSIIQHHSNLLSYVFMGSKKTLLEAIFTDKKRAFYKSVKHFSIAEISLPSWKEFLQARFRATNKEIDDVLIDEIYKITKGFPYYTQQFAYELWHIVKDKASQKDIKDTLTLILQREHNYFLLEWDNLTKNQKITLKLIIENNGEKLYDNAQIKNSSLQTALKALKEKDIIDKNKENYYLVDPMFEFWLKTITIDNFNLEILYNKEYKLF